MMRTIQTLTAFVAAFTVVPVSHVGADSGAMVLLEGGGFLRGSLEAVDDARVVWRHDSSGGVFELPSAQVESLVFDSLAPDPAAADVVFLDQGQVVGQIISLDAEAMKVSSKMLGDFEIPRAVVRGFRFGAGGGEALVDGFPPLSQWMVSRRDGRGATAWSQDGPLLRYNGAGDEDLLLPIEGLPGTYEVRLELRMGEPETARARRSTEFSLVLGADESGGGGYALNFTPEMLFVQRDVAGERVHPAVIGRVNLAEHLHGMRQIRLRVLVDRDRGDLHIFLNGTLAASLGDPRGLGDPIDGEAIVFQGKNSLPMRARHFSVRAWDGHLEEVPPTGERRSDQSSDRIETMPQGGSSNSIYIGEVVEVRRNDRGERELMLRTPHLRDGNALPVPVGIIRSVSLAGNGEPTGAEDWSDEMVLLVLRDSTRIPARLSGGGARTLRVEPIHGAAVDLALEHLVRVDWVRAGDGEASDDRQSRIIEVEF